ncbi:uncharacterized protein [Littorina saxatilis]|uniref:Uncharacterized protein n=1 Tax=Littorina saxatilis TaxID=31220 RepID=A0AAN9BFP1_9CAEN
MGDSKDEMVTETMIVGVTESGIIRKRSVKRRISRDDLHAAKDRKYGNDKEDYIKLYERVMADRAASSAVEVLQERWRMIMFMYEDCMELVKQWDEERLMKQQKRRKRRLLFLSFVSLPFLLVIVTWLLARLCW